MRLFRFDELPARRWRNGGGITRELGCFPQGAGLDDFIWRASIADVAQSGPFSRFAGVDRIIMLLEGGGIRLDIENDGRHALTERFMPHRFPGEAMVHAEPAGAPSRDFNLMLRRDLADGELRIWRTAAEIQPEDGFVLLFCAAGAWRIGTPQLQAHDTLTGPFAATRLLPLQPDSVLVGVRVQTTSSINGKNGDANQ
jgi:environmental stress-induced protein Ves